MQTQAPPWQYVLTAVAPSVPGWQIQRDRWGTVDFYFEGCFVAPERVPSHVRDELSAALAKRVAA